MSNTGTGASRQMANATTMTNSKATGASPNAGDAKKSKVVSIVIQVIVGLIATYIIYQVALYIMNIDKLVIDDKYDIVKKKHVRVIDGFMDGSTMNTKFNTTMPLADNYLPIVPSVNIKGGAQFTYCMWVHKDSNADVANKIIFLKGDAKRYSFNIQDVKNTTVPQIIKQNELMVFCPMLKFSSNGSYEVVFNTLNRYDETMRIDIISSDDSAYRNNLIAILDNTWHMITVSFEDNVPINDFENGILVKFYINDILYKIGRFSSALKQNHGDLHLFPNGTNILSNVKISNFSYYNYVLSENEIRANALAGANTKPSSTYMKPTSAKPPVLSDYNKLDIYNI